MSDPRDPGSTRSNAWHRVADRLARYGWRVLLLALFVALVGGIIEVFVWEPGAGPTSDDCLRPPCGPESMPGLRDIATVLPILGYLLVIVLGIPSLFAGAWDLARARLMDGSFRLLAFVGPLLVLVGMEILPHLVNVGLCAVVTQLCTGTDISDRWHPLDHAVLGALPMTALYWWIRQKLLRELVLDPTRDYQRQSA